MAIDKAWSYDPERLWLHTCTDDDPGALSNDTKRGFQIPTRKRSEHSLKGRPKMSRVECRHEKC